MSMRPVIRNRQGQELQNASPKRTVCEVLREINDLHQGDTQTDITTRGLVREAVDMAKRMDLALKDYNKEYDSGWWAENADYETDLNRRIATDYLALDEMPDEIRRIPSMGGREIGRYLRKWARNMPKGFDAVELGAWLGAGTAQIALGCREGNGGDVHVYDRFNANRSERDKAAAVGIKIEGDTSLWVRRALKAAGLDRWVMLHKGEIPDLSYDGGHIGLYVDDACKREKQFLGALRKFGPHFVAGQTIIVLMDFWYFERKPTVKGLTFQRDWMRAHDDCFEDVMERMPGTSARAFGYTGGEPWSE